MVMLKRLADAERDGDRVYAVIKSVAGSSDGKAKGLTGEQGVMIPAANERHLMLSAEVREAVAAGHFHVWSVESIDQGIEILTGVPAGVRDENGDWPEGTVHHAVSARLEGFGEGLKGENDEERKKDEDGCSGCE